jgi:hypothetical protein
MSTKEARATYYPVDEAMDQQEAANSRPVYQIGDRIFPDSLFVRKLPKTLPLIDAS